MLVELNEAEARQIKAAVIAVVSGVDTRTDDEKNIIRKMTLLIETLLTVIR